MLWSYVQEGLEHHRVQDHLYFRNFRGNPFYPNAKQLEYFATGLIARERALIAANRFGKTLTISLENSAHLTGRYPDWWNGYRYDRPINSWAAGISAVETATLKGYYIGDSNELGWIHPSLIIEEKKQEKLYLIRHISGGVSKLRFKTYEQGRKAWQAEKVDTIHPDEECSYEIYSEALTRTATTSSGDYGMIMPSLTPLMGMTQFILHYRQREDDSGEVFNVASGEVHNSIVYIHATHDDASHIPDDEKERLYRSYSPKDREARTKGIPSIGSGLVYPIHESKYVCSPFVIPDHWPRFFGLDFGWHHPTAAVFLAHDQDNDVVYAYAEYAASQLTPQHHAYQLIRQGANWMPAAYDHAGEAANQIDGSNVVDLYKEAGIRNIIPADKRSVNKGIYTILQRLENGKLKLFSTLVKTLTEIRMYAHDENGKIKKGNDDCLDAMRYAIVSALPRAKVKPNVSTQWQNTFGNAQGGWMTM